MTAVYVRTPAAARATALAAPPPLRPASRPDGIRWWATSRWLLGATTWARAADCASCETKSGQLNRIEPAIELVGPLDDPQRQRLMEIADKCPVHRTLHSELQVPPMLLAAIDLCRVALIGQGYLAHSVQHRGVVTAAEQLADLQPREIRARVG